MCGCELLSPKSEVSVRATQASPLTVISLASLAAGAFVDTVLPTLGLPSTNYIAFLSSANVSSDLFSIKFIIGGEERQTFLGAELSGSNANACAANACERGECVGAIETLTLRITNISAAAFAASATASVRLARYFPGDGVRYTCDRDRNALVKTATDCKTGCAVPGTQGTPVL